MRRLGGAINARRSLENIAQKLDVSQIHSPKIYWFSQIAHVVAKDDRSDPYRKER